MGTRHDQKSYLNTATELQSGSTRNMACPDRTQLEKKRAEVTEHREGSFAEPFIRVLKLIVEKGGKGRAATNGSTIPRRTLHWQGSVKKAGKKTSLIRSRKKPEGK